MNRPTDPLDELVDREALRNRLEEELGSPDRFEIERHSGGHSNETLYLRWDDRRLVLRRPPADETADTAHDVLREFRVLSGLQGTDVPVPRTVLVCEDPTVIGSEFYVMERLEGRVIRHEEPSEFADPAVRRRISEEFIDTLAKIHRIDYERRGLGDFGKPEHYNRRQVDRWKKQLDWAVDRTREVRELPQLFEVADWLSENVREAPRHAIVHGDYKLDNVMFSRESPPTLVGVFDWEMSTLGDPLVDLGWMLCFWHEASDPEPTLPDVFPIYTRKPGYLTRRELVERYQRHLGVEFENPRFYRTLGLFKLAAILEMFYARHLTGNTDDPLYPKMEVGVPAIAERALKVIKTGPTSY